MKKTLLAFLFIGLSTGLALGLAPLVIAAEPQWVVVQPGDTLYSIAVRNGTTVEALVRANNLPNPNFVYVGQRLRIPRSNAGHGSPPAPKPAPQRTNAQNVVYYTVRPGDTLASISARFGVTLATIAQANGIKDLNFIWYGQRLLIPGATSVAGANPVLVVNNQPVSAPSSTNVSPTRLYSNAESKGLTAAPVTNPPTTGKWIEVNVTRQTITAWEGNVALKTILVSTGVARTPTVLGTFTIKSKYPRVHMRGGTPGVDYYDLPNVPWTMFFYKGYAIHGTYWHNNFGRPMSHGCVNLPTDEAKWFYDWAPIGTPVVVHK